MAGNARSVEGLRTVFICLFATGKRYDRAFERAAQESVTLILFRIASALCCKACRLPALHKIAAGQDQFLGHFRRRAATLMLIDLGSQIFHIYL